MTFGNAKNDRPNIPLMPEREGERTNPAPRELIEALPPNEREEYERMEAEFRSLGGRMLLRSDMRSAVPQDDAQRLRELFDGMRAMLLRHIGGVAPAWEALDTDGGEAKREELKEMDTDIQSVAEELDRAYETSGRFLLTRNQLEKLMNARQIYDVALSDPAVKGTASEQSLHKQIAIINFLESLNPRKSAEFQAANDHPRGSILEKPARGIVGLGAAALFVMSLIIAIRNRKSPGPMDIALTAGYGAIAALSLGIISPKERSAFTKTYETMGRFQSEAYRPVRALVRDTIGEDLAIAATRDVHEELRDNPSARRALQGQLRSGYVTREFVDEHFGPATVSALKRCKNSQRALFLGILFNENVHTPDGRDAIISAWGNMGKFSGIDDSNA